MNMIYPQQKAPRLEKKACRDFKKLRVAISGKSGCGNSTVSTLLSQQLGITHINYTFRNLSVRMHMSMTELTQRAKNDPSIDYYLDSLQVKRAKNHTCVLASRLAIWLLPEAWIRVYLEASIKVRAKRIQQREGMPFSQCLQETKQRDLEDEIRYQNYYNVDINDYTFVDLIIATDTLTPDQIVQYIILHEYIQNYYHSKDPV